MPRRRKTLHPPTAARERVYSLREVFNGLRSMVKTGAPWRWMPIDPPPREAVYQQAQRWLAAGCFEQLAYDLRALLRLSSRRSSEPSAAILDSRTLHSSLESGERSGYDGADRKKGSKAHFAVDTLGHLLALHATSALADDRAQADRLAQAVQAATGASVDLADVDRGYTGEKPAQAARGHGMESEVVKLPRSQARLRPAAAAMGGRALLRLGDALLSLRQGLRALSSHSRRSPHRRLRLPYIKSRS